MRNLSKKRQEELVGEVKKFKLANRIDSRVKNILLSLSLEVIFSCMSE